MPAPRESLLALIVPPCISRAELSHPAFFAPLNAVSKRRSGSRIKNCP